VLASNVIGLPVTSGVETVNDAVGGVAAEAGAAPSAKTAIAPTRAMTAA
jgi:hypothetical protein